MFDVQVRRWGVISAIAVTILSAAVQAHAGLTIFLPENATYRYVNATAATSGFVPNGNDWAAIDFDDSEWFVGQGVFGDSFGGDLGNNNGPQTPESQFPSGTVWDVHFDPFVRTTFVLPEAMNLTLWLAVDNGVFGAFLNGVQATASVNAEGAAHRWEHVFDIPAEYTFAGVNTLALQLEDHGAATGFALVITADDDADNPIFSTEPPPQPPVATPEPASISLVGLGALGMALSAIRRRRTSPSGGQ